MFLTFKMGLLLGLSIIISIGAQNLFVIKQGLRNERPFLSALLCSLCDLFLIILGVSGVALLIQQFPLLKIFMLALGVVFLSYCGIIAIKRGLNVTSIQANLALLRNLKETKISAAKLILLALSFSLLNPQAILDTTVIIGGNASSYHDQFKYFFVLGTIAASFVWFFGIAIATNFLGKKLMNVKFWCALEYISGSVMMLFAFKLLKDLIAGI